MVLSPSGLIMAGRTVSSLGRHYILMKIRERVTLDGGTSVLAVGLAELPEKPVSRYARAPMQLSSSTPICEKSTDVAVAKSPQMVRR